MHYGVFSRIYVGFLPVGHTHEDIDQFFSRLAVYLRHHNARSLPEMKECIREAFLKYAKRPVVAHWDNVANISGWLDASLNTMAGIASYHSFRLKKTDGRVKLQVREWPGNDRHEKWLGLRDNHIDHDVFKGDVPSLVKRDVPPAQRPQGQTQLSDDEFAEQVQKYRKGMHRVAKAYPTFASEGHLERCLNLVEAWATPLNTAFTFDWDEDDIRGLLTSEPDDDGDVLPEDEPEPRLHVMAGYFYMYIPTEEEKQQFPDIPFYVLKIKKREQSAGRTYVRVQYWEMCEPTVKGADGKVEPLLCKYVLSLFLIFVYTPHAFVCFCLQVRA